MKAILIIAHHCILPGAYNGFEKILDKLHHDLPGTRVSSTCLPDLENDLLTLLREDVESVTLLPYLLLNGQHTKYDVPKVVAKLQSEFLHIPIKLLPCIGDWDEFLNMVAKCVAKSQNNFDEKISKNTPEIESRKFNLMPMELNLENRNVLVVGGGTIALRKVKTLVHTGARITVVAPQIDNRIIELGVTCLNKNYESSDLRYMSFVFICTDKPIVNAQVNNDAHARRIFVNNACDFRSGDFIVPAQILVGKSISVTVSTQGRAPALSKKLKETIQSKWVNSLKDIENKYDDEKLVDRS